MRQRRRVTSSHSAGPSGPAARAASLRSAAGGAFGTPDRPLRGATAGSFGPWETDVIDPGNGARAINACASMRRHVPRYVVLLRGVNLAGRNKLAMADLRKWLEVEGFTDVVTKGASGNAVVA